MCISYVQFAITISHTKGINISTDYAHNRMKPLPTINEWKVIKDAYLRYVDEDQVFIESDKANNGYNFDINEELYYAASGIKRKRIVCFEGYIQGELLHNGQRTDLIFPNAMGFRR